MRPQERVGELGFVRVASIRPVDGGRGCRAVITRPMEGFLVYALIAEEQIKKFGKTKGSIGRRICGHASALDGVLRHGRKLNDPFKRLARTVITRNEEIEVWARCFAEETYSQVEL